MANRGGNPVRGMMDEGQTRRRSWLQAITDIYSELTKVTWPSREDAVRLSLMVIAVAATMAVFLGLWDLGFSRLIEWLFL